jgi:ketosteroid isomerase-like protein
VTEFQELEVEWAGIVERRDAEAARDFLADDFVLSSTGGVGPSVPKDEWLAALDEIDTRSLVPRDLDVRVFGDVAVVSARLRWEATLRDQDLTGDYAVTDVFTRANGRWRASWRISVRLP